MITTLNVRTTRQGLHEITDAVRSVVGAACGGAAPANGLCTVFIRHTSASLVIQENADPSARRDLEAWMNTIAPEGDPAYTHNDEGPDDMPSHLKAAVTNVSLGIPIVGGELALGRWQGIYLWEHRRGGAREREVVVHVGVDQQ